MNWDYPKPRDFTQYFTPVCFAPFCTPEWSTRTQGALDDLELEEDDRSYKVERLLRWRWRGPSGRRHKEYLVLWAGYSVDDASWTPASNFDYPEELQKMIDRDNPVEDIAMMIRWLWPLGRVWAPAIMPLHCLVFCMVVSLGF